MKLKVSDFLLCVECGWPYHVPTRALQVAYLKGGRAVSVEVGKVVRCTRCLTEQGVGPTGAFRLGEGGRTPPPPHDKLKRPVAHSMRDTDQPWDKGG